MWTYWLLRIDLDKCKTFHISLLKWPRKNTLACYLGNVFSSACKYSIVYLLKLWYALKLERHCHFVFAHNSHDKFYLNLKCILTITTVHYHIAIIVFAYIMWEWGANFGVGVGWTHESTNYKIWTTESWCWTPWLKLLIWNTSIEFDFFPLLSLMEQTEIIWIF